MAVLFICYTSVAVAILLDGVDGIQEGSIIFDTTVEKQAVSTTILYPVAMLLLDKIYAILH